MDKFFNVLRSVELFNEIEDDKLEAMLKCLGAELQDVKKEQIILLTGDKPRHVGIVLSGQLHIFKEDAEGNRSLTATALPGSLFAEALCCAGVEESPVTVIAECDSVVMLIGFMRILRTCSNSCPFHTALIKNMLEVIAAKNLRLQKRMEIISLKTIRQKVLHYLGMFTPEQGGEIIIPFNREELADFLCVERSALSHELARMKRDRLLEYNRNRFVLK